MKLLLLGTGTSHGVPVIGCDCAVCNSTDKKDKRFRASALFTTAAGTNILIDVGPDFRMQALEHKINKLDMVLLTHSHADHLHGLDDLRIFSCDMWKKPENPAALKQFNAPPIPIYTNESTIRDLTYRFAYFFVPVKEGGGHARVELKEASKPFVVDEVTITPIPMMHGHLPTVGWLFTRTEPDGSKKSIAYLTDCNFISDEAFALLQKSAGLDSGGVLEELVIDGLRIKSHSTHFSILEAMQAADKIGVKNMWVTHLTHNASHKEYTEYMQEQKGALSGIRGTAEPAYDGLELLV
jgi:phosphoribosyl 1,2-cyclic phosphate phosphodiesterase